MPAPCQDCDVRKEEVPKNNMAEGGERTPEHFPSQGLQELHPSPTTNPDLLRKEEEERTCQLVRQELEAVAGWKKTFIGSLTRCLSAASSGPEHERSSGAPKPESKGLPESEMLLTEMTTTQHKALQPAFQTPAEEQTGTGGTASEAGMRNNPAPVTDSASATATDSVSVTDLAAAATSSTENAHTHATQSSIAAHDMTIHERQSNGVIPSQV